MFIYHAWTFTEEGSFALRDVWVEDGRIREVRPAKDCPPSERRKSVSDGSPDHNPDKCSGENPGRRLLSPGCRTDSAVTPGQSGCIGNDGEDWIDGTGLYLIPGLTDIHFHGCGGVDFCDGTEEAFQTIAAYEAKNGVTTICPATMTYPEEKLARICQSAHAFLLQQNSRDGLADLVGIHLEGPFLSMEKRGAQNPLYIHKPDVDMYRRLQEQAGGMIRIVDLAPEAEGAIDFIRQVHGEAVCSIAHTTTDYDAAMEAFAGGATHVTHLYNAMPPHSHRAPGVVGAASDTENCQVELICDGIHVHPSVCRSTFRNFGKDRVIMISDSMMAAGMPDGMYTLGGQPVKVEGTLATLADGTIAGSATNLMQCLRVAVRQMQIPLETAVWCAAVTPAKSIGIYDRYGSITPGKTANLVLLDTELNLAQVILHGRCIL